MALLTIEYLYRRAQPDFSFLVTAVQALEHLTGLKPQKEG
jgi:hypothetical protein